MSITRAYNKHSGVYYAYDVQYVWNEEAQKKVPVRKCIGKFDPDTNEVIPNGKRGPKPKRDTHEAESVSGSPINDEGNNDSRKTIDNVDLVNAITGGFQQINGTLQEIMSYMKHIASSSQDK